LMSLPMGHQMNSAVTTTIAVTVFMISTVSMVGWVIAVGEVEV
jgi:hypothetical protein